jgi:DNA-binding YbaB/EbfC family protein
MAPAVTRSALAQRAPVAMIGNLGDSLKKAQDLMKNISPEKIKKAQEMSMKMADLQKELAATEIECKSADGKITVIYTGQSVPMSVSIDPEAMSRSAPDLSEALTSALKQAFVNSRKHADGRMMELYEEAGLGDLLRMQAAQQQQEGN